MSTFPVLKTGAVLQYPAERRAQFSTQRVQFLDGSEQRFSDYAAPLHRWVIRLDALDEIEMHQLREFFRTQRGASGSFSFTDPWDGTVYANCLVENDALTQTFTLEARGGAQIVVRENRL